MIARIQKEFAELERTRPAGYMSSRKLQDLQWLVRMQMPDETPYEHCELQLLFIFPSDYPHSPPMVLPQHEIYHPNLKQDINASLAILQDDWSQFLNVSKILLAVQAVLIEPDLQIPLSNELLDRYQEDMEAFEGDARAIANQAAKNGVGAEEQLQANVEVESLSAIRGVGADIPEMLRDLDSSPERIPSVIKPSKQPVPQILELQHEDAPSEDKSPPMRPEPVSLASSSVMEQCKQSISQISKFCGQLQGELKTVTSEHSKKVINQQLSDLNSLRLVVWQRYFQLYSRQMRTQLQM